LLPEGDVAIIFADQPRTLRDQQKSSCYRVVDILGHLRHHLSGQVGVEAGDQGRCDDGARHELVWAARSLKVLWRIDRLVNARVQEGFLVRLAVLDPQIVSSGPLRRDPLRRRHWCCSSCWLAWGCRGKTTRP